MSERLIWRPNSFTPEEWAALSREQQIQWWKDQNVKSPDQPPPDPLHRVKRYEEGVYTPHELPLVIFELLTPDNVEEFIAQCPEDVLRQLRQDTARFPDDDDEQGWQGFRILEIVSYAPWVTKEEIDHVQKERQSRRCNAIRIGVGLFRAAIDQCEG